MPKPLYPRLDPVEYLEVANELSSKLQQAARRTAADRAYYAAFLTSRERLAAKGYFTPLYNSDDHQRVLDVLRQKNVLGNFGNEENRLRRSRNRVTYDNRDLSYAQPPDTRSLTWMLETAREIIKRVEALPNSSNTP
jgi:hypothetical protein